MKDGTLYAERLKKAFTKLRKTSTVSDPPEAIDPVRGLALGVLGSDFGEAAAARHLDRALTTMVDWNEIRVSNAMELSEAAGETSSDGIKRCQNLIDALQAVYDRENKVSLDRLKSLGRREARQYLESLKGVDEYAAAAVLLWSFGGHAIPVSNRLLEALRTEELVHPQATRAEVQAFMERNIGASQVREFCLVMQTFASTKRSSNRRKVGKKAGANRETAK